MIVQFYRINSLYIAHESCLVMVCTRKCFEVAGSRTILRCKHRKQQQVLLFSFGYQSSPLRGRQNDILDFRIFLQSQQLLIGVATFAHPALPYGEVPLNGGSCFDNFPKYRVVREDPSNHFMNILAECTLRLLILLRIWSVEAISLYASFL